jgi:hypothetical protein
VLIYYSNRLLAICICEPTPPLPSTSTLPLLADPGQNEPLHGTQSVDIPGEKKRTYRPPQHICHETKDKCPPRKQDETSCDAFQLQGVEVAEGDKPFFCESSQTRVGTRENQQRQNDEINKLTERPSRPRLVEFALILRPPPQSGPSAPKHRPVSQCEPWHCGYANE